MLFAGACTRDPEAAKRNLLATGNKYFSSGKYKEASILYRKAIQQDRRFGEAYYRLALTELELGRVAEAVGALERATELEPANADAFAKLADLYLAIYFANQSAAKEVLERIAQLAERGEEFLAGSFDLLRLKGFLALHGKNYEDAIASFRAAAGQRPEDGRAALGLAESLDAAGRAEEAEKVARAFLEKHSSFAGMYDFLYVRYMRAQKTREAEEILRAKCAHNPAQTDYWLQLAGHYHVAGDRARMSEILRQLLAEPQRHPDVYSSVGDFYMRIAQFEQALETYRKGAEADPKRRADFERKMVEALAFQGRVGEAFELVERLLAQNPKDNQARAMRGALRLRGGDPKEIDAAIQDFEAALAAMPDNAVVRFNLAETYLAKGNSERAIVEYQEAVRRRPDYLDPRYGLARAHLLKRDYAQALAVADEILVLRPGDLRAKLIQSVAWLQLGKPDLARSGLEEILRRAPQAAEAMFQLAMLNFLEKKYDQAEHWLRRLGEASPSDRRSVLGLVEVELARGRRERAAAILEARIRAEGDDLDWRRALASVAARTRDFDRAAQEWNFVLSRQPNDGAAHRELGRVYMEQQKMAEAQRQFERAVELMPQDPGASLLLAMVLQVRGDSRTAAQYYQRVIDLAPDHPVALNNLAFILAESGEDLDRALTLAQRARSRAPHNPDIADTLAWVYVKKNLNDSAITILEELVARQPDNASWRYHLGVALYQKGELERARRELEAALRSTPSTQDAARIRELLAKLAG
jgi:tetratricopeptide (TPR) repeat protein